MRNFQYRLALVAVIAVFAVFAVVGLLSIESNRMAQAADGGITRWWVTTVFDGSASKTGTQYSGGIYAANYGAVQIQVTSDVSITTSTLTIVPQYSVDPVDTCSSASNWFDAKETYIYNAQTNQITSQQVNTTTTTVVTNTSTITQEVGYVITSTASTAAPTLGAVAYSFTVTGDSTEAREYPVMGICMRFKLSVTNSDTYTPTIYARLVNRQ